ncbi:class I SAM-dependent methyltransferase [Bradyrhizobium lablabi]|uniref:class I SAM-dependent methyltransferase n=1 Tax=Bradyrhizobium lablabi TaxID=722472 RepID=UPI00090AA367|nr:class I SAM-dependent methyltransferase [Bradyrhizobium lablabi]SHM57260.1 tRNA (cmo5U34)-methyltransferase [Bradyrhizobium lablabi]
MRRDAVAARITAFSDPEAVARYADGPPRFVPGYGVMQSMTTLLLAERVPEDARVLVVGAGGGLELKVFAQAHARWTFDGIDPSAEMLKLAEQTLGPLATRARLHQGYIDGAPQGPFDAATCLLTLHFMDIEERRRTAIEVRRRLKRGSPFVVAHLSFPQGEDERALWLSRHAAFLIASGLEPEKAANARVAIDTQTHILDPEQDEAILREAGFSNVSLFYAAFSFRGWVAYA